MAGPCESLCRLLRGTGSQALPLGSKLETAAHLLALPDTLFPDRQRFVLEWLCGALKGAAPRLHPGVWELLGRVVGRDAADGGGEVCDVQTPIHAAEQPVDTTMAPAVTLAPAAGVTASDPNSWMVSAHETLATVGEVQLRASSGRTLQLHPSVATRLAQSSKLVLQAAAAALKSSSSPSEGQSDLSESAGVGSAPPSEALAREVEKTMRRLLIDLPHTFIPPTDALV